MPTLKSSLIKPSKSMLFFHIWNANFSVTPINSQMYMTKPKQVQKKLSENTGKTFSVIMPSFTCRGGHIYGNYSKVRSPIPSPLPLKMLGYLCLRKCFRIKSSPKFWFNLDSRLPWLRFFCRSIFLKMPVIHLLWAAYFVSTVSTEEEAFSANQLSANSLTEISWLFVSLF